MTEACSFFARLPPFPHPVDGDLDTAAFLSAADGIRSFVHLLGPTLFLPVTQDIGGNVDKLTDILVRDECATLSSIVGHEKDVSGFRIGSDALLWLTRAFDFVSLFLTFWVQDYESGFREEDLTLYFKKAYELTLKRHHNWFVTKIVFVILSGAPSRSQLIAALFTTDASQLTAAHEELLFKEIGQHVATLKTNIECIRKHFDAVAFDWKA